MGDHSEAFVALDVAKLKNAVAIAEAGRRGEVRYLGEIDNTFEATRKLVGKLAAKHQRLTFCYEAGPTGYGLYRWIESLGHECQVVAPSLIPTKPGDRVKTNRRDAESLAKLLRAGDLTAVWVPDEKHEAIRDLARARDASVRDLRAKRQQVTSFLLRHGRSFPGKTTWGKSHARWLAEQKFAHHAHHLVLQEGIGAVRDADTRLARTERSLLELANGWAMGPLADALQAMRGIDRIAAITFLAEIGDLSRFDNPRQLMGYLGLVPSERSTGDSVKRGSITKTGNGHARRTLIECAWGYRHPARIGRLKLYQTRHLPTPVQDIAWKAQVRLCARYRALTTRGKKSTVAATAIAREMAAFIWAIAREVASATQTA